MKKQKLIPMFGLFQGEDLSILNNFTKNTWDVEPQSMGTAISDEIFAGLTFREEIEVPAVVIGTRFLGDDHPNYNKIKEARNCKVIVILQEGLIKEQWYSHSNWPDYFFDLSKKEIFKACVQLSKYEKLPKPTTIS